MDGDVGDHAVAGGDDDDAGTAGNVGEDDNERR